MQILGNTLFVEKATKFWSTFHFLEVNPSHSYKVGDY